MRADFVKYNFNFKNKPISMIGRSSVDSDLAIINMVFQNEMFDFGMYKQSLLIKRYLEKLIKHLQKPLFVDAGANIGASSLYFSLNYADLKIFAIKPDNENSQICRNNLLGTDFDLFEGALHSNNDELLLNTKDFGPISYRVAPSGEKKINSITVNEILSVQDSNIKPFIIKIDIERWESKLFEENTEWIDKFPLIIIELHDWMLPGECSSKSFIKAISNYNFDMIYRGENIFCFNIDILGSLSIDNG